jgi:hypothetical protein
VGTGVTHFCIALSNFLHSRYLSRTAYLEVNASHEICALSRERDTAAPFRHQGVTYYPDVTIRHIAEVTQLKYKFYILDFGRPTPHAFPEFLRCDHRIILTDTAIWKTAELDRFAAELQKNNIAWDTCKIVCMRGEKSDCARLSRIFGIQVISAPELRDPFHITSGQFPFFEKIMKGE